MSQVTVKKCGLRFEPPAIVLIYSRQSLFGTELRSRTIPAKDVKTSPIATVARNMKSCERHRQYLEQVPDWQIEKLLKMLKEKSQGRRKEDIIKDAKEKLSINPEEDLNKVDEKTLQIKKAVMNKTFEMNRKKPEDADFTYDLVVDFDIGARIETNEWDDPSEIEAF